MIPDFRFLYICGQLIHVPIDSIHNLKNFSALDGFKN